MSLKLVTVYPDLGPTVPSTRAVVLLVDGKDGELKCIMGGTSLTGVRTGAVSGLSCRYLARKDSRRLAMIGAGGQGFYQISGVASQLESARSRSSTLTGATEEEAHRELREGTQPEG